MAQKIVLGYWGIRGLGQLSRLVLAYSGLQWEDVQYTEREQWFEKDKSSLGFDFPNLPYLIDGDFKLTQSDAIVRYIVARSNKTDLLGKDIKDQARVNALLGVLKDTNTAYSSLFWDPEYEGKLAAAAQKVKAKLELLSKFYGEKPFALGYLTIADFQVAESSNYLEKLFPELFKSYEFLDRTRKAFNELPEIVKYYESQKAMKGPFLPPIAKIQM